MTSRRTRNPVTVPPATPDPPASPERHVQHTPPNDNFNNLVSRLAEALKNGHTHMSLLPEEAPDASDDESSDNGDSEAVNLIPQRIQTTLPDPTITPPETFDGKPAKFATFMAQCTLHITLCTNTFRTDEQRVLFVASYLRNEPLTWALEIVNDPNHTLRHNYVAFKDALTRIYGNQVYKLQAEEKILRLS